MLRRGLGPETTALAFSAAGAAASFAFGVAAARVLDPVDRGRLLVMQLSVTLALPLAAFGAGQAAVYFANAHRSRAACYCRAAGRISTTAALVTAAAGAAVIAVTTDDAVWAWYFCSIAPFSAAGVLADLYRAEGRVTAWSAVRLAVVVSSLAGLGLLWLAGLRSLSLVVAAATFPVAGVYLAVLALRRRHPPRPALPDRIDLRERSDLAGGGGEDVGADRQAPAGREAGELLRFGAAGVVSGLLNGASRRVDQILLAGLLAGSAELGVYAVAVTYSSVGFVVAASIGQPTSVMVAGAPPGQRKRLAIAASRRAARLLAGASLVTALCGLVVIEPLFGPGYRAAVLPAMVLTVGAGVYAVGAVIGEMLRAMGRPGLVVAGEMVGLVVQAALFVVLVPVYSIVGAAWASALGYGAATTVLAALLWRGGPPAAPEGPGPDLASGRLESERDEEVVGCWHTTSPG